MKWTITSLAFLFFIVSCNSKQGNEPVQPSKQLSDSIKQELAKQRFFPVTDYLEGQLYDISQKALNPLKYTTIKEHTDSVYLKLEELRPAIAAFLEPRIDSMNLISLFTEKRFMDQTLDAITFTYEPTAQLPDTMKLTHWDVYIDPLTGKVKRVYMVKQVTENKTLQLTWLGDHWCKIVTIITDAAGNSVVEREEKITWDF